MADIFRHAGDMFMERYGATLPSVARKAFAAIRNCRTLEMGARLYQCGKCNKSHVQYNSCRNRNCPTCQGNAAHRWLDRQISRVLPAPYFHLVFTLPKSIAAIAYANRKTVFDILMKTAAETVTVIAADPRFLGAKTGGTAVLHSWDQRLQWHPHAHVVVANAGFDANGQWKTGSDTFFAPVKVLARYFRRRFLEQLDEAYRCQQLKFPGRISHLESPQAFQTLLDEARTTDWVVYAKPPFAGPKQLLRYLSRYTHRVAIGSSRILGFDGANVTFRYRKPSRKGQSKPGYGKMTLPVAEFIRRYLSHVLPRGFHRIRHFGILANGSVKHTLRKLSEQTDCTAQQDSESAPERHAAPACPQCQTPMLLVRICTPDEINWLAAAISTARAPPLQAA